MRRLNMWCRHHTNPSHSQSIRPEDKVYAVESRIGPNEIISCDSGRIGFRTMCHTRWTIQIDALGSVISNCIVLQSMWYYAKDFDRARYGDEGKNSRPFVSYEYIPLPVRDHAWRTTANTPTTWAELCNTSRVGHEYEKVASMTVETLKGIRSDDH